MTDTKYIDEGFVATMLCLTKENTVLPIDYLVKRPIENYPNNSSKDINILIRYATKDMFGNGYIPIDVIAVKGITAGVIWDEPIDSYNKIA